MATHCDGDRAELSRLANAACVPLFIGNYFAADGRTPDTPSATATLVRFKGRLFVVTCEHVRKTAYAAPGQTASVGVGRTIINLSSWGADSSTGQAQLIPALRQLRLESNRDLSIAAVPAHYLDLLNRYKTKVPIDLDRHQAPDWSRVKFGLAVGFPNRLKAADGDALLSKMIEVTAELNSTPGPNDAFVTLHSEASAPSEYGLSGISGGPIFALTDQLPPLPIGIVFEGHPSGEDTDRDASQAFLNENDLFIRGLVLTPATFATWLDKCGLD